MCIRSDPEPIYAICGKRRCSGVAVRGSMPAVVTEMMETRTNVAGTPKSRAKGRKPSCDDCYFRCNLLCALALDEPCATFRPDHPDGLRPPRQLRFVFRQPGRTTAAWAFPNAQEQASIHA
jgi:hypothetical protein